MTLSTQEVLLTVLREASVAAQLGDRQWDLLLRQARSADLLARLAHDLDAAGMAKAIPARVSAHLQSERVVESAQRRDVMWEVEALKGVLEPLGLPLVLLKGAAYLVAGLPVSRGRLFNDVDVLVPRARLEEVERALSLNGWLPAKRDPYDQRYYREWMHELPPLRHTRRHTTLDVHHNILPLTARWRPSPGKLLDAAVTVTAYPGVKVLAPPDMVLHSAAHLFSEGEWERGLRDLVDIDGLLRHFAAQGEFWRDLVEQARQHDLRRPVYYSLRYAQRMLATPVPGWVMKETAPWGPSWPMASLMEALFRRGLAPAHPSCDRPCGAMARHALYLRGHYLRMPMRLLLPHLLRKALRARFEGDAVEQ